MPHPQSVPAVLDDQRLDRQALEACTIRFFRQGWAALPDVRLVEWQHRLWVVKDWGARSWLRRKLQGQFMLRRECGFLLRLRGIEGVPHVLGFPDENCLAIEYHEGTPSSRVYPQDYPPGFFVRLTEMLREIHARGVTHGDLDQDDNVLVTPQGTPAIIDFGNALARSSWPVLRQAYDLLSLHDWHCVWRLRLRFDLARTPDEVPPPPLKDWHRFVLRFFNKIDRNELERVHGVGQAPPN